jgi:hypothetical protein
MQVTKEILSDIWNNDSTFSPFMDKRRIDKCRYHIWSQRKTLKHKSWNSFSCNWFLQPYVFLAGIKYHLIGWVMS